MIKYFIYELKKDIPTLLFTALLLIILIVPYNTKFEGLAVGSGLLIAAYIPVSYTHLTLPTKA